MVDQTLALLQSWYSEPTQGNERPKLLSKLAIIELCGWIEGEFDRLVRAADSACLNDTIWTEDLIKKTNGFHYADHFRPMLSRMLGEVLVRKVEADFEQNFPGELEQLSSILGQLWRQRCSFAHSNLIQNVATQQNFAAPSWAQNQYRVIRRRLQQFEASLIRVVAQI